MLYKIVRKLSYINKCSDWNSSSWRDIPSELLQNYMGSRPEHFPKTEVKIVYNDTSAYLMFRVEDRYVRAAAQEHQGNVWEDSCVEFFFTPDSDISLGYFNLEMNCGGTMLFHFHPEAGKERIVIPKSECSKMVCSHSLPQIVDPEIREPVTWTVAYSIPISLLKKYCKVITPALNVEWRANFYKCADKTSHPHWLTWFPVYFSKPNFHIPESFGILKSANLNC